MQRARIIAGLAGVLAAALPGPAGAHHSYAMFDMTKTVDLKGTVEQFKWTNPHAWLVITVKDASGQPVTWNVEMNSPNNLMLNGWKRSVIKAGDQVVVTVHPLKENKAGGSLTAIVLAGGQSLKG